MGPFGKITFLLVPTLLQREEEGPPLIEDIERQDAKIGERSRLEKKHGRPKEAEKEKKGHQEPEETHMTKK